MWSPSRESNSTRYTPRQYNALYRQRGRRCVLDYSSIIWDIVLANFRDGVGRMKDLFHFQKSLGFFNRMRHRWNKERAWRWLAFRLPTKLVYWATVRLIAHATTGDFADTFIPELTVMDALERWE